MPRAARKRGGGRGREGIKGKWKAFHWKAFWKAFQEEESSFLESFPGKWKAFQEETEGAGETKTKSETQRVSGEKEREGAREVKENGESKRVSEREQERERKTERE